MPTTPRLAHRDWLPSNADNRTTGLALTAAGCAGAELAHQFESLAHESRRQSEQRCINLDPASNVMNPRAEALLSSGVGSRPSLGYPGSKSGMGLEAIEKIEVFTQELAAEIFDSSYVEYRIPSGTLANLCVYMALMRPGDTMIALPGTVGGHVSHHSNGVAGRYGLEIVTAPIDADRYGVDLDGLRALAHDVQPRMIVIGGSLNLFEPDLQAVRSIADEVGAWVMFDAAHMAGLIAGGVWRNPLHCGAHVMTMSTYKSLAGPTAGLVLTNHADIARKVEAVAFPALTANFDVAKIGALGMTLLDWKAFGAEQASTMQACARHLARALREAGVDVFASQFGGTDSHQLAFRASNGMGAWDSVVLLGRANMLAGTIGLPADRDRQESAGVRVGTPEIVRWGMTPPDMTHLAGLIADVLLTRRSIADVGRDVAALKSSFNKLHYVSE